MVRYSLLLIFLLTGLTVFSQKLEFSSSTLAGTKDKLPFWLWANQLGRYNPESNFIQDFSITGNYRHQFGKSDFDFHSGGSIDLLLNHQNDIRFTELYGGFSWKPLFITAGAFADSLRYDGLSSTNGNMAASLNARPHPKIRAGFNRFVKILPGLFVNGFYEEGLLNDKRYVSDTHLHRKAFYLRAGNPRSIQITGGMEHFVMWWGTHPVYGELQGWEAYFDYVLGKAGGSDALATDKANVAGNSYGTYQLEIRKDWENLGIRFYLSHPFDDHSGMDLKNYRDNLYGLFITRPSNDLLIKSVVVEYIYTKHQSGRFHVISGPDGDIAAHGADNYYNHGVYRSGVTYEGMAMVSPMFGPVRSSDGIPMGFESTRFAGFHLGALGNLTQNLKWKGMLTYTKHFGQYKGETENSYSPPRKQFSGLLELSWTPQELPLAIGASAALDHGRVLDSGDSQTRLGTMLKVSWQIAK